MAKRLGLRWTIGDVSNFGFEALRYSLWSALQLFGRQARYAVCVNGLAVGVARDKAGDVPDHIEWLRSEELIPAWLDSHVDKEMAEGVAWKLCPVRLFPHLHEISFDNDVILWSVPRAMKRWLESGDPEACLMAEDAQRSLGQFADLCDSRSINSGIRGLAPGFDLDKRLQETLRGTGIKLRSELDEQGLQAATLSRAGLELVGTTDVSICSPFSMHQKVLGRCGVHFVGLNRKRMPWIINGHPAHEAVRELWLSHRDGVEGKIWPRLKPALALDLSLAACNRGTCLGESIEDQL